MVKAALAIAKQWRWSKTDVELLMKDLRDYNSSKAPFAGGGRDGLVWWESLPISAQAHPLKRMAITLLSVVPHTAELERLFSQLGGTQSAKRCNLTVDRFETLGRLRNHYCSVLWEYKKSTGQSVHRKHPHMHTAAESGVNKDLVDDLEATFTWTPPFSAPNPNPDVPMGGLEEITEEEIEEAFGSVEKSIREERDSGSAKDPDGCEVLEGRVYNFEALDRVDKGLIPAAEDEETTLVGSGDEEEWTVDSVMQNM
ncbi:hypothetical protein NMY22_g4510 [Coprinellus aureogranulatus]|nr:hypothetical protein NMY22_g4510 [Coprinellus aureogranulatus]